MEKNNYLEIYRNEIDLIDEEILNKIAQRQNIVKKIGIYKKQNNIQILQKGRWEELLNKNIEIGKKLGLSKELIEDIWNRIHSESLKIEKNKL